MKKIYALGMLLSLLLLGACGSEEAEMDAAPEEQLDEKKTAEADVANEVDAVEEEPKSTLTEENLKEIIEFNGTGEEDQLISSEFLNGEVRAVILLGDNDLLTDGEFAVTRYSQLSDELLSYDGWEVLSVEYEGIGTITMNQSEKVTDDWGMTYFPTDVISSKLN